MSGNKYCEIIKTNYLLAAYESALGSSNSVQRCDMASGQQGLKDN